MVAVPGIKIVPFKSNSGKYNMDYDSYLFDSFEHGNDQPVLRLYGWEKPCISLGHSQDPDIELNLANCVKHGIEVVKRPSGGGIVFHNEFEATYSLICDKNDPRLPEGLVESYKVISRLVIEALKEVGVPAELSDTRHHEQARLCFSFPASYEITVNGCKVVGSAQKRGKKALLQQGSIFLRNSRLKPSNFIRNCIDFRSIYDLIERDIDRDELLTKLSTLFIVFFQ